MGLVDLQHANKKNAYQPARLLSLIRIAIRILENKTHNLAAVQLKEQDGIRLAWCANRRPRSACASAQSAQSLRFTLHIYTQKNNWRILKFFWLYNIWEYSFQTIFFFIGRIITMQFTKMQIEFHGSLVTIQYYSKYTDPLYQKFTSKIFSALIFCWNLYQVIAYVLIPTTDKS